MPAARHGQPVRAHGAWLVKAWWAWLSLLALDSFPARNPSFSLLSTFTPVTLFSPGSRETIKSWLSGSALLSFGSWQPNKAWWANWSRQAVRASLTRCTFLSLGSIQALGTLNPLKAHRARGARRTGRPWLHYDLGQAFLQVVGS